MKGREMTSSEYKIRTVVILALLLTWAHLTTCSIASHSRMFARNLLPSPSPLDAPLTSPAMSVNSTVARTICCGDTISASLRRRASCTSTTAVFGSIVQNG